MSKTNGLSSAINYPIIPGMFLFRFHQHRGLPQWGWAHSPPYSPCSLLFGWLGPRMGRYIGHETLQKNATSASWRTSEWKYASVDASPHPVRDSQTHSSILNVCSKTQTSHLQRLHPIRWRFVLVREDRRAGRWRGPLVFLSKHQLNFQTLTNSIIFHDDTEAAFMISKAT